MTKILKSLLCVAILLTSACSSTPPQPSAPPNKWGVLLICRPSATTFPTADFHEMGRAMCDGLKDRFAGHGIPVQTIYLEDHETNPRQVIPGALARAPKDGLVQLVINSGSNGMRKETAADLSYLSISFTRAPGGSNAIMGSGPAKHYLLAKRDENLANIDFDAALDDFMRLLEKGQIIPVIGG